MIEALACGVPAFGTPVGIHPVALHGIEGAYCAEWDRDAWRAALRPHLEAADPRVDGRARAELFSADAMAARVVEAWRDLLARTNLLTGTIRSTRSWRPEGDPILDRSGPRADEESRRPMSGLFKRLSSRRSAGPEGTEPPTAAEHGTADAPATPPAEPSGHQSLLTDPAAPTRVLREGEQPPRDPSRPRDPNAHTVSACRRRPSPPSRSTDRRRRSARPARRLWPAPAPPTAPDPTRRAPFAAAGPARRCGSSRSPTCPPGWTPTSSPPRPAPAPAAASCAAGSPSCAPRANCCCATSAASSTRCTARPTTSSTRRTVACARRSWRG